MRLTIIRFLLFNIALLVALFIIKTTGVEAMLSAFIALYILEPYVIQKQ